MSRTTLGELEEQILLVLLHLDGEGYAVPVVEEMEKRTGRSVSATAAYMVLRRLEARGLLESRLGDPTPERGGRPKRYFRIKEDALPFLRDSMRARQALWRGLESVLADRT